MFRGFYIDDLILVIGAAYIQGSRVGQIIYKLAFDLYIFDIFTWYLRGAYFCPVSLLEDDLFVAYKKCFFIKLVMDHYYPVEEKA